MFGIHPLLTFSSVNTEFEFSVNNSGEIEFISLIGEVTEFHDILPNVCNDLLKLLIQKGQIQLDQRSKGFIKVQDFNVTCTYEVCSDIGEDWGQEVWDEKDSSCYLPDYIFPLT